MAVESATYATQFNTASPASTDPRSEGDDHLRLIKAVIATELDSTNKGWAYSGLSAVWHSATRVRIDSDESGVFEVGRRVKAVGTATGTLYGQVTSATYSASTSVNFRWDASALSDEALQFWLGAPDNSLPQLDELSASLSAEIARVDTLSASLSAEISRVDTLSASLSAVISQVDTLSASLSHHMAYGSIYNVANTTDIEGTSSLSLMVAWDLPGIANLVSVGTATGGLVVTNAGHYLVDVNMDISASGSATFEFMVLVDAATSSMHTRIQSTAADKQNAAHMTGIVTAGAGQTIHVYYAQRNGPASNITVNNGQFLVRRLD